MDHFISMYIDNELSLDEKILFLEHASGNRGYTDEAVSLLTQEKELRTVLRHTAPEIELPVRQKGKIMPFSVQSLGWAVAACVLLVFSFTLWHDFSPQQQVTSLPTPSLHRFVLHQQGTEQVEITGSFTNWQRVPLVPTGTDGYWEVSLEIPAGEHRYTFIIDGSKILPDPTVAARESDDFGATNSILKVKA